MADRRAEIDHVWKLIEDIPIAMVVTHEGQGQNMRARPMAVRPARDEGAIFFLTDADTPKAEEVRRNQSVCLALSDNKSQKYVSISGHAEMIDDRARVEKYWSVYDKAFWSDKNDPRIKSFASRRRAPSSGRGRGRLSPRSNWSRRSLPGSGWIISARTRKLDFLRAASSLVEARRSQSVRVGASRNPRLAYRRRLGSATSWRPRRTSQAGAGRSRRRLAAVRLA